ncbi:MAG TPA: TetR/AcrR family transcriptional regulator [Caulobacteraceae bacterium]|nr:TetR/AcrR family transcriptional regulator [Caulobacteraceae bacterium]
MSSACAKFKRLQKLVDQLINMTPYRRQAEFGGEEEMGSLDTRSDVRTGHAARTQAGRRAVAERGLLAAAIGLIAERGLERFTMAEVGLAAGYSRGLPAHYFGSKDGLIAAVAAHIVKLWNKGLERRLALRPGLDGLLATVGFYFDGAARDPKAARALSVLLVEALHHPALAAEVAELNRLGVGELERQLRYGIEQGRIRADIDAPGEAILILAGLRGAVTLWLIDPDKIRLGALRDAYVASLRRSLAA